MSRKLGEYLRNVSNQPTYSKSNAWPGEDKRSGANEMQKRSAAVRGCAQRAEQKSESCMTRTALHVVLRSRNLSAYYSHGREDDLWPPDPNAHSL